MESVGVRGTSAPHRTTGRCVIATAEIRARGSYDRLARFKATFLNDFVAVNHISTVIEFGSGDGSQLALATYPDYVGVDVSETALAATGRRFADKPSIRFLHTSEVTDRHRPNCRCPWTSSTTWSKTPFSTPTCLGFSVQQHDSSWCTPATKTGPGRHPHVRHRNFTQWVKEHQPDFDFVERVQNPYPYSEDDPDNTSFCDFFVFTRSV